MEVSKYNTTIRQGEERIRYVVLEDCVTEPLHHLVVEVIVNQRR